MAEVNIKLTFDNKSEKNKTAYFEMLHTTVIRVEESAVNKDELKKIFLSDVPTEMYPEIEKRFFEIVKSMAFCIEFKFLTSHSIAIAEPP